MELMAEEGLQAVLRVVAALHESGSTPSRFYEAALDAVVTTVGADRASLLLYDPDGVLRFKAWRGLSAEYRQAVEGHTPWSPEDADAVPILVPDVFADPELAAYAPVFAAEGIGALAFIPLIHHERVVGKFMLYHNKPLEFSAGEIAVARGVAGQVVLSLDRRRAAEVERMSAVRLAGLQLVTAELSRALTVADVAAVVVGTARSQLGARSAALCTVAGDELEIVEAVGYPSEVMTHWRRFPLDADLPASEAVRTGRPTFLRSPAERDALYPVFGSSPVVGDDAFAMTPLGTDGPVGCLIFGFPEAREFPPEDVAFLSSLTDQCAAALHRAQLYEDRVRLSRTLQASLLPPSLPEIPGIDLAARHASGSAGLEVGGDFYDVFRLDGDRFVLVLGDVCGRGVDAATIASLVRHTARSAALTHTSPAAIVAHLNDLLLRDSDPDRYEPRFCTAIVAIVDHSSPTVTVKMAVAGHPLPLLRKADGALTPVGAPGSLIGVGTPVELSETDLVLGPGDALVCYTDGVTERRNGSAFFEYTGLSRTLAAADGDAQALAAAVENAVLGFAPEPPGDDLAILVLRAEEPSAVDPS